MTGTSGRWSILIIVVCWGRFSIYNTTRTLCPEPAVPEDAILITLNSDLNQTCAGCDGRGSWSRHSPHGTQRLLAESGHLVLNSVTYEDEDNYTCHKDGAPVCSVQLIVKDERQEDSRPSCYHRYPAHNITCEWKPRRRLHPSSRVTLVRDIVLMRPRFNPCTYNSTSETFTCTSPHNEGDSTRQNFYLCVSGRSSSQLIPSLNADVTDLLHIGPPLNVRVTPVENHPRRLRVNWSRPEFWESDFYGLRYQVLYWVEGSLHQSNGTTTDVEESFVIRDAVMGRKHVVRVRAREEFQKENWGSWSEEAAGVPWSDGVARTLEPSEYDSPTSEWEEDPENEVAGQGEEPSQMTLRSAWIVPCFAFGLVVFFFLGLWIRYQEIKILKLKWGFLRSLFHPSFKVHTAQPLVRESVLRPSPSSVAVTVPPLLDGE